MANSQPRVLKTLVAQDAVAVDIPINRNIVVNGHRTSVRFEPVMWEALKEICRRERLSLNEIATLVSANKASLTSLTAAMRLFILSYYRAAATDDGHQRAGHGAETAQSGIVLTPRAFLLLKPQCTLKK